MARTKVNEYRFAGARAEDTAGAHSERLATLARVFDIKPPVKLDTGYHISFVGCGGNECAYVRFIWHGLDGYTITETWCNSFVDYSPAEFQSVANTKLYERFCAAHRAADAAANIAAAKGGS